MSVNVFGGRALKWCQERNLYIKSRGSSAKSAPTSTHLLLTQGSLMIHDSFVDDFLQVYADDVRAECAPCISQRRSAVFPMYADLDMFLPLETLCEDAVLLLTRVVNERAALFFQDEEQRAQVMRVIVCTKTGKAKRGEDGQYKHGVHLHWPHLHVNTDKALQLRLAMIEGLYQRRELDALLGFEAGRPPWEVMVDESVYNSGLRMVGAPKASKCVCFGKSDVIACDKCKRNNNQHIIDPSVYVFRMAMGADGARLAPLEHRLASNLIYLLKSTSVRLNQDAAETPGFKAYEGAPALVSRETGKKRKAVEGKEDRKCVECTNTPEVEKVIRAHLVKHSPHYAHSRFRIMYNDKYETVRVSLQGDGANFCLNKGTTHTSQNVYMEFVRDARERGKLISRMRCWCRKDVKRPNTDMRCRDFESTRKVVNPTEERTLMLHIKGKGLL